MITEQLAELVKASLRAIAEEGIIEAEAPPEPSFERPKRREHGDWSTNVAMVVPRKRSPREVAEALVKNLPPSDLIAQAEVAGPGFINFHLSPRWLYDVVREAADEAVPFGRTDIGRGARVNVEYVSANPTGPINVVSGRHAAVGDALASLLSATGHVVEQEYYVNDAGTQILLFARSIAARYLQHYGRDAEIPEEGYQGDYIMELAKEIAEEVGDRYIDASDEERVEAMRARGLPRMLEQMSESLEGFGTAFDRWMRESELHEADLISKGIANLTASGMTEERDGALFFKSSELGDDKDRVLLRATGQPTYFAADVGYLLHKFERGYDHLIYLWGSGHHGAVQRLLAAAQALGFDRDRVEVPLVQTVRLVRGGEVVLASKRAGNVIPLDDLVNEVGKDAARYIFLTRSMDAPLDFDIELAKEQAPENPVYYVQYQHARICSILRLANEQSLDPDPSTTPLEPLVNESEDALMRKLATYSDVILVAAEQRAPQKITRFVEELAATFSAFYRDSRVVTDDLELSNARVALCLATKRVLADGLGLLGVTAPERM